MGNRDNTGASQLIKPGEGTGNVAVGPTIEVTNGQTIFHCIQRVAERAGQLSALISSNGVVFTYVNLYEEIRKNINALNNMGIGRDDRVVLAVSDRLTLAITLLGVSAAAVCAPLNPLYRQDECVSLFSELRPKAVIVDAACRLEAALAASRLSIPL